MLEISNIHSWNGRKRNYLVGQAPERCSKNDNSGRIEDEVDPDYNPQQKFIWDEDRPARENYAGLGRVLAEFWVLFRCPQYGGGMLLLLPDGKHSTITRGPDLLPVIVDNVDVMTIKNGKATGTIISSRHLNTMLKSRSFLDEFITLDHISRVPMYLPDFSITKVGFNDGGSDQRILYVGQPPVISRSLETITSFLDVMEFETNADRTGCVAGAVTVLLRNLWAGHKPIVTVTANKSHAGKDTVIMFATGIHRSVSISYEATDWALERDFVEGVKKDPEVGVVVIENARLNGHCRQIASAFIERFAMDPEPQLCSTRSGPSRRVRNNYVMAISTNFGMVSEDIINRSLPIYLNSKGNVADRKPSIGNPKAFLTDNREKIASELFGMIEKWDDAGQPFDNDVGHSFSDWAKTVGGILKVNGFTDFLKNYGVRKTADDPLRKGLAILGATKPDQWLRSADWANQAATLGLTKSVIPSGDQDSEAGRARGIGAVLSAHESETLIFEDDERRLVLRLDKKRSRFEEGEPHHRFQFAVLEETKKFDEPMRDPK